MSYAIEMNFDKAASNKIKKLWTSLKYHKICDFMADNGIEPHLTLCVLADEAEKSEGHITTLVENFFANEKPIRVDVVSVGVFPNEANVVFLSPVVTKHLLDVQERLYKLLDEAGYGDYITERNKPHNWNPYVTMTMNIKETDMIDALKLLKRKFKPMTATLESAAFLRIYPIEYKANIVLG